MNEATLVIVIGLVLDIIGALLIIGPIRNRRQLAKILFQTFTEISEDTDNRKKNKYEISPLNNKKDIDRLVQSNFNRQKNELENYPKMIYGIIFLVVGFILQIIGNLILNPPFQTL